MQSGSDLNIIGDCNGRIKTLEALISKMPKAKPFSVGDMGDRTKGARQVFQYFKDLGAAIRGNHEDMMLSALLKDGKYGLGIWINNGGWATLDSYNSDMQSLFDLQSERHAEGMRMARETLENASDGALRRWVGDNVQLLYEADIEASYPGVDKEHIEWLKNLPYFHQQDGLLITHAPIENHYDLTNPHAEFPERFTWFRGEPELIDGFVNVFGHVHNYLRSDRLRYDHGKDATHFPAKEPTKFYDKSQKLFGICIDTDFENRLTGLHWPSMELFHQEFLD